MEKHQEEFKKMEIALKQEGYLEKDVTFTAKKASVMGILYSIPFIVILGFIYRYFLIDRAHLTEITGSSFYLMFIGVVIISVFIHEVLHGIGWSFSSGNGWQAVRFNINALMPSCACKSPLKKQPYLIGVLFPLCVLGTASTIFLFVYPGTVSILTMFVNFVAAGADLITASNVLKETDSLIVDHQTEAGYIAFYK